MNHTTEIVKSEQITDECIAVTVQCCGDGRTASTLTIAGIQGLSAEQIQAQVDAHHDAVARKHAGMLAGHDHIRNLPNVTKEHKL